MQLHNLPRSIKFGVMALVIAAASMGGYIYRGTIPINEAKAASPAVPAQASNSGGSGAAPVVKFPDFAEIASEQGPAVVNISVSGSVKTRFSLPQMDPNDPLYEFFRRFQVPPQDDRVPTHGLGSGFIVSPDGVILTNAHVVSGADEVIVKLTDKREFKAKVIAIDKLSDVAVLKIKADGLPTVKIGDPQNARVGEWVIAIGSPFGFENTVTAGIISAKSRSLPDEGYVPFLQTDVPVNPGNSGGPLFNMKGEVIGINSQIYSRSGGFQGLSFAIPIDVAMNVERQLLDHGKVSRGRLGVMVQDVDQQLADTFGLDKPAGALVSSVEKNSPAEKAGIRPGDVILEFDGNGIASSSDLPPLVSKLSPGTEANIELWRKGKILKISLSVGEMKVAGRKGDTGQENRVGLGLTVRPLTPEERKQADVASGLLVEDAGQGQAARAGIHSGDVILSVNGENAASIEKLSSLARKAHKPLALLILRGEQQIFVPVPLG
ncbi:MAG: DegQ family serine endoprotease [Gallionella sp.]